MTHRRLESLLMLGFDPGVVACDRPIRDHRRWSGSLHSGYTRHYAADYAVGSTLCGILNRPIDVRQGKAPIVFCTACLQAVEERLKLSDDDKHD